MKHVTIKDVAKATGMSISTISRALNDCHDINPKTRQIIISKASELGYVPNPNARRLAMKKSLTIGVVVPEFLNIFFPKAIMGIQEVLSKAGYQTLIMSSNECAETELNNVQTLEKNMIDGLIISLTQSTRDISYYKDLNTRGMPIVQFNRINEKIDGSKIVFDDYNWAYKATEHLLKNGCRNIYHLTGPQNLILTHRRQKGFIDACKDYGIKNSGSRCIEAGIFNDDGDKAMRKLINSVSKDDIDGIFCFNDPLAMGVYSVLKENKIRIPLDISVVGFTESQFASQISPTLTSVEQPAINIGREAAQCMLEAIKYGDMYSPRTIVMEGKLHIRESSDNR